MSEATDSASRRDRAAVAVYVSFLIAGPLAAVVFPVVYWRLGWFVDLLFGARDADAAQRRLDEF